MIFPKKTSVLSLQDGGFCAIIYAYEIKMTLCALKALDILTFGVIFAVHGSYTSSGVISRVKEKLCELRGYPLIHSDDKKCFL